MSFYYPSGSTHTFRNTETSSATGYITLKRISTDPPGDFNLVYKYDGNGTYSPINYTYQWISFNAGTANIELTGNGSYFTVSITFGRSGTVEIFSENNTLLTTVNFPNTLLSPYSKRVKIEPTWGAVGKNVTGRYTDSSGTYYAPDITKEL